MKKQKKIISEEDLIISDLRQVFRKYERLVRRERALRSASNLKISIK
ncbi:MAG: hypothetical protein ABH833_00820 [Parcubacteria group bacterium]